MIKSRLTNFLPLPTRWTQEGTEFDVQGETATVYWIPTGSTEIMGRTTAFNTIRLNERIRREYPHHLVEYVVLHEMGHASRSRVFRIKHYALLTLLPILAFILVVFAVSVANESLRAGSALSGGFSAVVFLVAILTGGAFRREKWAEELHAELYALDSLGMEEFARRREELGQMRERGIRGKISRRLFYPGLFEVLAASQAP